jgi:hypothetical protein
MNDAAHLIRNRKPIPDADLKIERLTAYQRKLRKDWSETDRPAWNLHRETSDLLSREELLTGAEISFIKWVRRTCLRGHIDSPQTEAWIAPLHLRRIGHLVQRHSDQMLAADWLRRQREQAA